MPIKALLIDVDGVLIDGRPEDGRHWQTSLEADLGISPDALREHLFAPHWERIVVGQAALMPHLTDALHTIAPTVSPTTLISYWFARDARLDTSLLAELACARATGVQVHLATNQEHLRATYLMETLGLAQQVDAIFYSARLGAKKPEPEFFAKVQVAVGMRADELLLVDDSRPNVDAAQRAGWHALHWTPMMRPDTLRATYR